MSNLFHDENINQRINTKGIPFLKDVLSLIDKKPNECIAFKSVQVFDRYEFAACVEELINNKKE